MYTFKTNNRATEKSILFRASILLSPNKILCEIKLTRTLHLLHWLACCQNNLVSLPSNVFYNFSKSEMKPFCNNSSTNILTTKLCNKL